MKICLTSALLFATFLLGNANAQSSFRVVPEAPEEPVIGDEVDPIITAYVKYLNNLDNENVKSILTGREEFQKTFSTAPVEVLNDAFRVFWGYHKNVINSLDREFYGKRNLQRVVGEISSLVKGGLNNPLPAFEKLNNEESNAIRQKYAAELQELYAYVNSGIDFTQGEGDWYLKEYLPFLIKMFPASEGNELREYLMFSCKEDTRIGEDAGLLITWEEYRERIIRWEQFKNRHPELLETQTEVEPELHGLVAGYLQGMPNTRAYSMETGILNAELKRSYESFIQKNKSSVFHRLIKKVYGILAKHDFKVDAELLKYLEANGFNESAKELERIRDQNLRQVKELHPPANLDDKPEKKMLSAAELAQLCGSTEDISTLISCLENKDSWLKQVALKKISEIGLPVAKETIPYLRKLLKEKDFMGKRNVVEALSKMGENAKAAVPELIGIIKDKKDTSLVEASEKVLGSLGPAAKDAIPTLLKELNGKYTNYKDYAANALAGIGIPAIPGLIKALESTDMWTRMAAAKALGNIGPAASKATPALSKLLHDAQVPYYKQTIESALKQINLSGKP